jgi:hypothetical protein
VQLLRSVFAPHPKLFGRGPSRAMAGATPQDSNLSADLKLFATTFVAGFLFISILIG